jgi:hypothetical protein
MMNNHRMRGDMQKPQHVGIEAVRCDRDSVARLKPALPPQWSLWSVV